MSKTDDNKEGGFYVVEGIIFSLFIAVDISSESEPEELEDIEDLEEL